MVVCVLFPVAACGPEEPDGEPGSSGPEAAPADEGVPGDTVAARGANGPAVLFFGTSLTAGYGLDDPDLAFPAVIGEKIDSAGLPYRVVNAGVPGETSAAGLRRISWVLGHTEVEALVLELGANDGLRGQDPEALRRNLQSVIDSTRTHAPDAAIVLAGMQAPPNLGPRYTGAFRRVFEEVARENDAELIPFLLEGVAGVAELNQDDRIHPNVEGHRTIARNVWPVLEPVLSRRTARSSATP